MKWLEVARANGPTSERLGGSIIKHENIQMDTRIDAQIFPVFYFAISGAAAQNGWQEPSKSSKWEGYASICHRAILKFPYKICVGKVAENLILGKFLNYSVRTYIVHESFASEKAKLYLKRNVYFTLDIWMMWVFRTISELFRIIL